jgi:hypothetical protein
VALVVTDPACALRAKASIHPRVNPWNSAKRLELITRSKPKRRSFSMKKRYRNRKKKANGKVREIGAGSVLLELPLPVAGVIESLPEVIRELAREAGWIPNAR